MPKRLNKVPAGLVEGYVRGILTQLAEKVEGPRLETEFLAEIQRLQFRMRFEHLPFEVGRLSSSQLNTVFERLQRTLNSLYRGFITSEQWQSQNINTYLSDQNVTERGINRLLQDIRNYKLMKLNPNYNDVRVINFVDTRNRATGGTALKVDPRSRGLRLVEMARSRLHERRGDLEPSITVEYLTDEVTGFGGQLNKPENAVDADEESYWLETVYSDDPVVSTYNSTDYNGFGVKITVDLMQVEQINRIDLKPFGQYPARLLALRTSTDNSTYTDIPGFSEPSATSVWWSFCMEPTVCRYIQAVVLQENYREHVFHLPKSIAKNRLLFDHIADKELRFTLGSREDSEIELRDHLANNSLGLTLDALGKLESRLASIPLPGDNSARIEDVNSLIEPVFDLLGTQDHSLSMSRRPLETSDDLLQQRKYTYEAGLFHFEASRAVYHNQGEFMSPKFSTQGNLWEVVLDCSPTHVSLTDEFDESYPATTAEFDIEISPTRRVPLLPEGTTTVNEVVNIDQRSHKAKLRFSTSGSPSMRKNGRPMASDTFSFDTSTGVLQINKDQYKRGCVYMATYTPNTGQDVFDVLSTYNALDLTSPEIFNGTDENGLLVLPRQPYVDFTKINNLGLFYKSEQDSRFHYRADQAQQTIDGEVWGIGQSTLSSDISATATSIGAVDTSSFGNSGTLIINAEKIKYTAKTGSAFTGVTRGFGGTVAVSHSSGAAVISKGKLVYDPIKVVIDGVRALNMTDYHRQEHPTLDPKSPNSLEYKYIHISNRLYFGSPIDASRRIEVTYRVMAEYVSLVTRFKQTVAGRRAYSPDLREVILYMNRAEI